MKAITSTPAIVRGRMPTSALNPEHPPLVKLLVTIPLLWSQPKSPALEERFSKRTLFFAVKNFSTRMILTRFLHAHAPSRSCCHSSLIYFRSKPAGPRRADHGGRGPRLFNVYIASNHSRCVVVGKA